MTRRGHAFVTSLLAPFRSKIEFFDVSIKVKRLKWFKMVEGHNSFSWILSENSIKNQMEKVSARYLEWSRSGVSLGPKRHLGLYAPHVQIEQSKYSCVGFRHTQTYPASLNKIWDGGGNSFALRFLIIYGRWNFLHLVFHPGLIFMFFWKLTKQPRWLFLSIFVNLLTLNAVLWICIKIWQTLIVSVRSASLLRHKMRKAERQGSHNNTSKTVN